MTIRAKKKFNQNAVTIQNPTINHLIPSFEQLPFYLFSYFFTDVLSDMRMLACANPNNLPKKTENDCMPLLRKLCVVKSSFPLNRLERRTLAASKIIAPDQESGILVKLISLKFIKLKLLFLR